MCKWGFQASSPGEGAFELEKGGSGHGGNWGAGERSRQRRQQAGQRSRSRCRRRREAHVSSRGAAVRTWVSFRVRQRVSSEVAPALPVLYLTLLLCSYTMHLDLFLLAGKLSLPNSGSLDGELRALVLSLLGLPVQWRVL